MTGNKNFENYFDVGSQYALAIMRFVYIIGLLSGNTKQQGGVIMHYYEKTLLTVYSSLESIAEQIENLLKAKAFASYKNFESVESQANRLIEMSEVRVDLLELKAELDDVLKEVDEETRILLGYKYFKEKKIANFDYTSRNYFRKQIKAVEKFSKILNRHGVTEEWFMKKYFTVAYIKNVYKKIVLEEGKKHTA